MTIKQGMSGIDEIATLINSRRKSILVHTYEEQRFEEDLQTLAESKNQKIYTWTITSALTDSFTGEVIEKIYDPIKMLQYINNFGESAIFLIKDFHDIWSNFQTKRQFRDVLEKDTKIYKPIILVSPQINIPMELEKLITMVTYNLPNREDMNTQLKAIETYLRNVELPVPEGRERVAILNALVGMTRSEAIDVLKKTVSKNKHISLDEIVAEKEQVIKKTGLLEYITKLGDMDQIGGMDALKDWVSDAQYAFDQESQDLAIDTAKGVIITGFPGTGKSAISKSIAHQWNIPLLKMSMSDILDSKVGQSEKNMSRALKLAESVSPCVLWIDEMEKALAGGDSSKSDGGTTSRIISELLTWLSDKEAPVFVVGTANDITALNPALTRAGRFDDIFFVSLPADSERRDIIKIHLEKRKYIVADNNLAVLSDSKFSKAELKIISENMIDFTGAEIEQVISQAGRLANAAYRRKERETHYMTTEDIIGIAKTTVPLSKRDPDLLTELRAWAKHAAKCASSEEHNLIHEVKTNLKDSPGAELELEFDFDNEE